MRAPTAGQEEGHKSMRGSDHSRNLDPPTPDGLLDAAATQVRLHDALCCGLVTWFREYWIFLRCNQAAKQKEGKGLTRSLEGCC